jgi:hypothetical protein
MKPKVGALLFLLGFSSLRGLPCAVATSQRLEGHVPRAASQLTPVGRLPAGQTLHLAIGLPLRDPGGLTNFLRDLYDPANPGYRHYLTSEEFTRRFGPSQADYEAVKAFARAHGLTITEHTNRLLVDVDGSVSNIEAALNVHLFLFPHPTEHRQFYAPDTEPSLDLSVPLLHISGLDDFALPKPMLQARPLDQASANATPLLGSGPSGTYRGSDFRAAYAPGVTLNGTGQSVGLLEFDGYTTSDITAYESEAGLTNVPLDNVFLDGFTGGPHGAEVEVCLDIEVAIAMAPSLSSVIVYQAGPYGNWHDMLNRMASDNLAHQLSCSWYIPGGGVDPVADQIFQEMAAQGQTFFAASGDYDAWTGLIPFPSDNVNVTTVGGTTLSTTGPGGPWSSETAWNRNNGIGTGGGISTSYTIPYWQTNVSMASNQGSTTQRNVPDVACTADNVDVRVDGLDEYVGGTSCAAPLWAGFTALINQQAAIYQHTTVGFLNPQAYAIAEGPGYDAAFHDITTGNNFGGSSQTKFSAVPGYDLCTGLGTPNGQGTINALAIPDPLVITPNAGFAASGATGGPFTVTNENITLTNVSGSNLTWAVGNPSSWLNALPTGGMLAPGQQTTLTAGLNAAAYTLTPGFYTNSLSITDQVTANVQPLSFSVLVHDPLVVTPAAGFLAIGPVNGPFNTNTESFVLTNSGSGPLDWSLNTTSLWLNLSAAGGTLAAGTATNVTVSLNAVASNLVGGVYLADVQFSNVDSGFEQDRFFTLETGQIPVQNNGFELGNFTGWTVAGSTQNVLVTSNAEYVHSGTYGAELGPPASFGYLSQSLPTSPGHGYLVSFWLENPAGGTPNEFQVLWNGAVVFDQMNMGAVGWTNIQLLLGAATTNTVLEFGYENSSGAFALDDVTVLQDAMATNPPVITMEPADITATAGWTAVFDASVSGIQPFSYQWESNGTNIPNATNAFLALSPVNANQAGTYAVAVTNVFGGTVSSNAVLTVNPAVCVAPAAGLTSWWRADGDATDAVGTNNGTLEGGVAFAPGESGEAFNFDGSTGIVVVPDSPGLRITNQLTLEAWINTTATNGAHDESIISKIGGSGGNNGYQIALSKNVLVGNFNTPGAGWPSEQIKCVIPIVPGTWNHVAFTYDQSAMVLYFNGQPVATNVIGPMAINTSSSDMEIGGTDNNTVYFRGLIDEVSVYSRALSTTEIQAIYNAASAGKCVTAVPPYVVIQPQDQTVPDGYTARFSVTATGTSPLSYQWLFNSTNLPGATAPTLTLTNVQATNDGTYAVVVTNAAGSTVSSNAMLTTYLATCDPPPAGLVSWWQAEGNAADTVGTNNGTLEGGVTYAAGEVGEAFSFDGSTGYVLVPDSSSLRFTSQLTLEAWINPNSTNPVNDEAILGKTAGAIDNSGYQLSLSKNLLVANLGVSGQIWPAEQVKCAVPIVPGTWCHVAFTYDQSAMTLYFNGQPVATNIIGPVPIATSGSALRISSDDGNSVYFAGLVDEASVYNRALSASEIQAVFHAAGAGKCVTAVPPLITRQPLNQSALIGSTASFSVSAEGASPLAYQWLFDGTNLAGATAPTLVLANVQATNDGTYAVLVTNVAGFTLSSNATLTTYLAACDPPPAGLISWWRAEGNTTDTVGTNNGTLEGGVNYSLGEVGEAFSFDGSTGYVLVPDSPSLRFTNQLTLETWINPNSTNPVNDESILGKTAGAFDNSGYQLSLSKNLIVANLGVPGKTWPAEQIKCAVPMVPGTWCHLAFTYNQSAMTLYFNGQPVATNTIGPVSIATSGSALRISSDDGNSVYFAGLVDEPSVYNRALSAAEIQAIYRAGGAGKCLTTVPPFITQQPQNQTFPAGSTVSFSVSAEGASPLAYQWLFDGASLAGATAPTLTLTNVQAANDGTYAVVVTNVAGTAVSSNATLTTYVETCDPPPTNLVSWWRAEGNVADSVGTNNGTLEGGVTYAAGQVGDALSFNGINGIVVVPDSPTLRISNQLTLEVWINDPATNGANDASILSKIGGTGGNNGYQLALSKNSLVANFNTPGASWPSRQLKSAVPIVPGAWCHMAFTYDQSAMKLYFNGQPVATNVIGPVTIATSSSSFEMGGTDNNNLVYFGGLIDEPSVYNRALSASEIQAIYQAGLAGKCPPDSAPRIVEQPAGQSVTVGGSAIFSVGATGTMPMNYQWFLNSGPLAGDTNSSLLLTGVGSTNAGTYTVTVSNLFGGTVSSNAALTLDFAPRITRQPVSLRAIVGCSAEFSAVATGTGTLTYQWNQNGSPIPGQTSNTFVLPGITTNDFATYTLTVSNSYGTTLSSNAVLSLDHPPVTSPVTLDRFASGGVRLNATGVLANDTDPDGDPLSLIGVDSHSSAGGTVSWQGQWIYYLPLAGQTNSLDQFNYIVSDSYCGGTTVGTAIIAVSTNTAPTARATIQLQPDGSVQISFDGEPGYTYRIQSTESLSPTDWQDVSTNTADDYGVILYVDQPASGTPTRYYRCVSP